MTANGNGPEIRVFDESGDMIGTTYPKRAKGLVRNGRARWLADTPNASDPVAEPDSIVLLRQAEIHPDDRLHGGGSITRSQSGAEAESAEQAPQNFDHTEDIMNEFDNRNRNAEEPTENEVRIQGMILKFQEEMAKAREIAEKAAADAQAAMEAARSQSRAAGEACVDSGDEDGQKTVGESLRGLGEKLGEAAETAAEGFKDAASEIRQNENVRETVEEVKGAGETLLSDAKKKLKRG